MNIETLLKDYDVIPYIDKYPNRMIEWAEALESGKYKQTKGQLRVQDRLCCLGVACDLYDPEHWKTDYYGNISYLADFYGLPSKVVNYYGDNYLRILVDKEDGYKHGFAFCNDTLGLTFKQIAWLIRESVRLGTEK